MVVRIIFFVCALLLVLAILGVFIFVGLNGVQSFLDKGGAKFPGFFTSNAWDPFGDNGDPTFGARDFILGSVITTAFSTVIATPLAFCVALFFNELAPKALLRFFQPLLEVFVGVPSVVIGFLGLVTIGPWIQKVSGPITGNSATGGFGFATAIIVLVIMILPTITSVSIDALRAVPGSVREASFALGSTRWQTMFKAILPAATPALATAVILGLSRAIGETLAVSMVLGGSSLPDNLFSLKAFFTPTSNITREIVQNFQESAGVARDAYWLLAFTLLIIAFLFVCVSRYFASRSVYK